MFTIDQLAAREVLDSRGRPTVAAWVVLAGGVTGTTQVPSGASTGEHEAVERRDGDMSRYGGAGVLHACQAVETEIAAAVAGRPFEDLAALDQALIELDGTSYKRRLGATPCWRSPRPPSARSPQQRGCRCTATSAISPACRRGCRCRTST
jgi:enolase